MAAFKLCRNAVVHLDGAELAADRDRDNAALRAIAIAIELLLKSHLLTTATDDRWNRRHIGHDLDKAARYAERAGLGLPPRLHSVIAQLHPHVQRGGFQRDPSRSWPTGFSLDARRIARQLAQAHLEQERRANDAHRS
jgi:HEPN domain-containing protein